MMTPNKKLRSAVVFLLIFHFSTCGFSDVKRYASGLGRDWDFWSSNSKGREKLNEADAVAKFIQENFGALSRDGVWRERKVSDDSTHSHRFYHFYYQGRRVDSIGLAIHYNKAGWVEYADSDLEEELSIDFEPDSQELRETVLARVQPELKRLAGRDYRSIEWEPILWRGEKRPQFVAAYRLRLIYENPLEEKNLMIEQETGEILSEFKKVRAFTATVKVYKNANVNSSGTDVALNSGNNIETDSDGALLNSVVHVRREQISGGVAQLKEITPLDKSVTPGSPTDYTTSSFFKTDPDDYNEACSGDPETNDCANQNFDGVNVYYHINRYRNLLNSRLSSMGNSTAFADDPLPVIVNSRSTILGSSDNAFYWDSTLCGSGMDRCLVFLPPTGTCLASNFCRLSGCPDGSKLNNLAREGFVVSHEYQHYITDVISGIEFGSSRNTTVGDALHEGYSDYGAATYLSDLNNPTNVTLGLIAFPACSSLRREVGTLRVYGETSAEAVEHNSGLSWASALWQLRKEYGSAIADKLALKSLYFLGANPGFIVAVESLVKADRALNAGVNVERIRELLYTEVKFLGSASKPFKNPETLEAQVGFSGCSGVGSQTGNSSPWVTLSFAVLWGLVTIYVGRTRQRFSA